MVNENRNGKVVAFWIEKDLLWELDRLVRIKEMKNRSTAVNLALREFFKKNKEE